MMEPEEINKIYSLLVSINGLNTQLAYAITELIRYIQKIKMEPLGNTNTTLSCAKSIDKEVTNENV